MLAVDTNPEFLSFASLLTLQGATIAVVMVVNVTGAVVGDGFATIRKWLALVLSIGFGLLGLTAIDHPVGRHWLVATLNGFMIAAAALGINEGTVKLSNVNSGNGFRRSWL